MPMGTCHHGGIPHQIDYDAFECRDCGMIFFGIEKSHPQFSKAIHYMRNRRTPGAIDPSTYIHAQTAPYASPNQHIPLDFQAIPEDLTDIKARMKELEKTLSVFVEILKSALQT